MKVTELNSLKTIFSRMTTVGGSVSQLQELGIAVKDSTGEMRPVARILDDLAGQWSGLNKEQQQSIGLIGSPL